MCVGLKELFRVKPEQKKSSLIAKGDESLLSIMWQTNLMFFDDKAPVSL